MTQLAYPSDFLGKLKLLEYTEQLGGFREELWQHEHFTARCVWFYSNNTEIPNTIVYKHNQLPWQTT